MADLQLGETMTARITYEADGGAYTTAALPFRPDHAQLVNLTTNAENDVMKAEWFRGMTDDHYMAINQCLNDGGGDCSSYIRVTSNGFTLNTTAAGVDSSETTNTISVVSLANPAVITVTAHGLSDGDMIRITDVVGTVELNNNRYRVNNVTTNTFVIQDPDSREDIDASNFTAWVSGGLVNRLNRVDALRDVFDAEQFTLSLGTDISGADSDQMQLIFMKYGQLTAVGDIA